MTEGLKLDPDERCKEIRRFYARDKGRTTLRELLAIIAEAATKKTIERIVSA